MVKNGKSMTCKNCKNHFNYSSDDGLCNACYKLKLEGKLEIAAEQSERKTMLDSVSVASKKNNNMYSKGLTCKECKVPVSNNSNSGFCRVCATKNGIFKEVRKKQLEKKEKKDLFVEEKDMGLFNFKKKEELKVKVLTCSRCGAQHQYTNGNDAAELLGFQRSHKCPDLVIAEIPPVPVPPPPAPDPTPTPMPSPSPVVDEDAPEYLDSEQGLPVEDDDGHEDRLYYLQQKLATLDEIFEELKNNGRKKGSM